MATDEILLETEEKMLKTEEHLVNQFAGVRTGKASPSLIENIHIDAYGSHMRLKELATITAPESRMLMVQPFDISNIKAIEKGIQGANLGLNPATQGKFIRIVLPDLSTERRQEFVKICKKMTEDGRVAIRSERRQAMDLLKKAKNDGTSEDEVKGAEEEVQKLTDGYIKKLEDHLAHKEKEILTV
jgi:ribosome recycling factor